MVRVQSGIPQDAATGSSDTYDRRHHNPPTPAHRDAPTETRQRDAPEGADMADASFDVVSKVDKQEVSNALTQSQKEISQRYDFKNVGASIEWSGDNILIKANSEERVLAVLDVFQTKLIKRNVSLKALDLGEKDPQLSGKEYRLEASLKDGINQEQAKKISKMIRDEYGKTVKPLIQGDELRVSSKSKDDLQAVMAMLRSADLEVAVQFTNYR
jgi:uncharacterized protein YajQ (UPF0234 family)